MFLTVWTDVGRNIQIIFFKHGKNQNIFIKLLRHKDYLFYLKWINGRFCHFLRAKITVKLDDFISSNHNYLPPWERKPPKTPSLRKCLRSLSSTTNYFSVLRKSWSLFAMKLRNLKLLSTSLLIENLYQGKIQANHLRIRRIRSSVWSNQFHPLCGQTALDLQGSRQRGCQCHPKGRVVAQKRGSSN